MKRREMEPEYWLVLQKRLLDSGFVTITAYERDSKNYWTPTPRGIRAYKTALILTKRKQLFKGPKFTKDELTEFQETEDYDIARHWLTKFDMVREIYDTKRKTDRYELVEYGYEFFQIYSDAITSGPRNPGPNILKRMAVATLTAIYLVCYMAVKYISESARKRREKERRKGYGR